MPEVYPVPVIGNSILVTNTFDTDKDAPTNADPLTEIVGIGLYAEPLLVIVIVEIPNPTIPDALLPTPTGLLNATVGTVV